MGWDQNYRRLEEGEVIRWGDEVQNDDGSWRIAVGIGRTAPDPDYTSHRTYRRKVPQSLTARGQRQ